MNLPLAHLFSAAAKDYDVSRRQLIPCFDAFYGTVLERLSAAFPPEAAIRVLDLGAGTGLVSALIAEAFPNASFVLADLSTGMLDKAQERFAGRSGLECIVLDLTSDPLPAGPFDVVVSALAIHHLPHNGKRALFQRIRSVLEPGGVFLNADQAAVDESRSQDWLMAVRATGVSEIVLAAALDRMKEDKNAPVLDQLRWLQEAGFEQADLFFLRWFFVVYGGRAPSQAD